MHRRGKAPRPTVGPAGGGVPSGSPTKGCPPSLSPKQAGSWRVVTQHEKQNNVPSPDVTLSQDVLTFAEGALEPLLPSYLEMEPLSLLPERQVLPTGGQRAAVGQHGTAPT